MKPIDTADLAIAGPAPTLREQNELLRRRIAELTPSANRWDAVRGDVTRFYRLYSRDERHELMSKRRDEGRIADEAADRLRMGT